MNTEHIEATLSELKGKSVYTILPVSINASLSVAGELQVVVTKDQSVGFHITAIGCSIIFFADDVESLEVPMTEAFKMTIKLKRK